MKRSEDAARAVSRDNQKVLRTVVKEAQIVNKIFMFLAFPQLKIDANRYRRV